MSQSFCILPFIHTAIEANGDIKGCCLTPSLKNEKGESLNLNTVPLKEALNSDAYKEFLGAFQRGEKPKLCYQCWADEDGGTFSNRQKFNIHFDELIQEKKSQNTLYERDFRYLEIKAGTLCNLKCRICGPHNSSRAAKEESERRNDPSWLEPIKQAQWVNNPQIWTDFSDFNLQRVHVMGGEPFMDNNHLPMLDRWIAEGRASQIQLYYNSNGTVLPIEHVKRFSHFKDVIISLSIDDIGPRFEYQRFPAKWNDVLKNFQYFGNLELSNLVVNVDICWSLMNIYFLQEITDFFENEVLTLNHFQRLSVPEGRHLYVGQDFCPKRLDPWQKEKYLARLDAFVGREGYEGLIVCLKNHILGEHHKGNSGKNDFNKIHAVDQFRSQKFKDVFPELNFIFD